MLRVNENELTFGKIADEWAKELANPTAPTAKIAPTASLTRS
jgi:hypothetical protein